MASSVRIPPHDLDAERAMLGAVLLAPETLRAIRSVVAPEDCYHPAHQLILRAMIALADAGTTIDHVTLAARLRDQGLLERVGGGVALAALPDATGTTASAGAYADIVAQHADRRALIVAAEEVAARGYLLQTTDSAETADYLTTSRLRIAHATTRRQRGTGPQRIDDELRAVARDLAQGKQQEGVIPTGIACYDRTYGGLWPRLTHVLAGRPGMGKSVIALNIGFNAALAGKRVLYVCMEDTRRQVVLRLLARFADLPLYAVAMGTLTGPEYTSLLGALPRLEGKPFWLDDTSGVTSDDVVRLALDHQATHGLDLLIIDHLSEVVDRGESETTITSHAAMAFRDVAKAAGVPLLLLCQLNRDLERRTVKRPALADLRQSGVIEQIARFVLFPYRGGYYEGDDARRDMELHVAKATNFPTGTLRWWADLEHMFVRGWEPEDGPWTGDEGGAAAPAVRHARTVVREEY